MKGLGYLVLAYGFIWVALAVYLFLLGRRLGRLGREVEELQRRTAEGPASHRPDR
jgi:CcmD family protein